MTATVSPANIVGVYTVVSFHIIDEKTGLLKQSDVNTDFVSRYYLYWPVLLLRVDLSFCLVPLTSWHICGVSNELRVFVYLGMS